MCCCTYGWVGLGGWEEKEGGWVEEDCTLSRLGRGGILRPALKLSSYVERVGGWVGGWVGGGEERVVESFFPWFERSGWVGGWVGRTVWKVYLTR